ncbi:MFS transporter (macronuclear) [Tetrahymena thermophila SB210]|uniref:Hexose transporter 1 n=1 Tax=Tetrahymena thermophila (strain SB210) TaxID=312017 RepID=Q22Y65_TETTS|nr:MFS transporter [Tetrahymena thermophila SB210]EAR90159.2 MFS transporter [Tetrahymena thermophila SB210]|eukprot:XP_001010404.2 MFS transporter [Tetrahymena thermophila SB210]
MEQKTQNQQKQNSSVIRNMEEQYNTVNEEQEYNSFNYILAIVLVANMGVLYFGYQLGVMSLAQNTIFIVFDVKHSQQNFYSSMIDSAIPFGAVFGALLSGKIQDFVSRKNSLILADIFGIITGLLCLFKNINLLVIARLFAGFVTGLNTSLVPKYIQEITPLSLVGVMGIFFTTSLNFGIVLANLNGQFFNEFPIPEDTYWYYVFFFPLLINITRMVLLQLFFNHETPFYYIINNENEKCKNLLKKIYKPQYVDQNYQQVRQLAENTNNIQESYRDMFNRQNRWRLFIGCTLQFFQQFSGINAVTMYLSQIYEKENYQFKTANLLTLLSSTAFFCAALVNTQIVQKYTRRIILIVGSAFTGLFILSLAILSEIDDKNITYLTVICIDCYYVAFNFSLGPIIWLYCSEILPQKGFSIATTVNQICGTIIVMMLPYFDKLWILFIFYSTVCFLCSIFTYFLVEETKNKSKLEIQKLYQPQESNEQKCIPLYQPI